MILQVPQALMLNPPGYGGDPNRMIDIGLSGLGQLLIACSDGSTINSDTGLCADGSIPVTAGASPVTAPPVAGATPQTGGNISASSIAQVIGAAGNAAGSAIMASNAPAGYVWNAAAGRYVPAVAGVPGTVAGAGLSTTVGISGSVILPLIGLVVVAGLLMVLRK